MKKAICIICSVFILASCSSDDKSVGENIIQGPAGFLKKITRTQFGDQATYTYLYNGTKIDRIIDDFQDYRIYTYSGDLITKMEIFTSANIFGGFRLQFEYDSQDQLVTYTKTVTGGSSNFGSKEVYVYNDDGTIGVTFYAGTATNQSTLEDTGTIYFIDGEVSQIATQYSGTRDYTYDTKYNPMMGVTGFDKISFCGKAAVGFDHNVTSELLNILGFDILTTTAYTYNTDNYPISAVETKDTEIINIDYAYY